jgi:hypothetical protein
MNPNPTVNPKPTLTLPYSKLWVNACLEGLPLCHGAFNLALTCHLAQLTAPLVLTALLVLCHSVALLC